MYYSKSIEKDLQNYYDMVQPSVVIIDMVRLVPYIDCFKNESVKKILIAEDDLAKRYSRQLRSNGSSSAVGYYAKNMSRLSNAISSQKLIKNSILKMEISRLQQYEDCFTQLFDYITFISPVETQDFNIRHNTNKAITLTMGADIDYLSEDVACEKKDNTLVFVGNFTYAPNADSIRWICKNIIPRLEGDIVFNVIGKCPDDIKKEIECENVRVLGYVDDIRVAVNSASVYLSPIVYGTGIKTKIIEAMAMGQAIVTNSIGAESLDVEDGVHLFIEDTIDGIVARINTLLNNKKLREEMGRNARDFVINNHSWRKVYSVFGEIGL